MPTTYTTNLALAKPEVGAARDVWGSMLNGNADVLDQFVASGMPIGAILDYAGPTPPAGWLVCDGRLVSRVTYSALFAKISTYWGAGDGSTTFKLPPAMGRAAVGPGTVTDVAGATLTLTFATTLGRISNSILQTHLPNYTLTTNTVAAHSHGGATTAAGAGTYGTDAQGSHSHAGATGGMSADHTHLGSTDAQGSHAHAITLPNIGTGAAGGSSPIMSTVFGSGSYVTDAAGIHAHNVTTAGASTGHYHVIAADGSHAHTVVIANHAHAISADGGHAHTVTLGGGSALFPVFQPVMVVTKIIYAGRQAMPALLATETEAAPAMTLEGHDELAAIRAEVAQLRALVAPQRPARMLAAPLRGSR